MTAMYVSGGRLVADCGRCGRLRIPTCGTISVCVHCHQIAAVDVPADLGDALQLLQMRPVTETRNWRPDRGETVDNLMRENAAHGLV